METRVKIYLLVLVLNYYNVVSQENGHKLFFSGYVKNLYEFSFADRLEQLNYDGLLNNRLNFKYNPSEEITMRIELRNRIFFGNNVKNFSGFRDIVSRDNGWADLSRNLINNEGILFNATIDRALINYTKGDWDITLGRQRVNWGMNVVWNPNDIFNTYNFMDFDYEERPGSDSFRAQYYLSDFDKLEVTVKKGSSKNDYILATMYKFNKWSYDVQLIAAINEEDWILGTGWAGNLKNAGFKGEISYFIPKENYNEFEDVLSASISVDYAFKNGLYINGSALYNTITDTNSGNFENLMYNMVTAKNLMPFDYSGFLQLSKEFSPIFSASMSAIYSPTNHSVILIPSFDYSLATDWALNFTGQSFFEFEDYKAIGTSLFIRLRWSF
ncbi:MAG: hypothetical protein A3F91_06230 [Flavobacteria bacterium RIFCSPLOWO2_12_FULL_35_11]|nr:MAG: hypothetical protein A3F91_06230 [Flavobacteria bacterium RIFCSPLOWO2_12_FULL_35_11]